MFAFTLYTVRQVARINFYQRATARATAYSALYEGLHAIARPSVTRVDQSKTV